MSPAFLAGCVAYLLYLSLQIFDVIHAAILAHAAYFTLSFLIFSLVVSRGRISDSLVDIGVILSGFFTLYSVYPLLIFFTGTYQVTNLAQLDPTDQDMIVNSWRHILFINLFNLSYITTSKKNVHIPLEHHYSRPTISLLLTLISAFLVLQILILALSAPVTTYYEYYTRFDHLNSEILIIVSAFIRATRGIIPFLLVLIFLRYKHHRLKALVFALAICIFDIYISRGSRIQSMFIIIQFLTIYCIVVSRINLARVAIYFSLALTLFAIIEFLRITKGISFVDFFQEIKVIGELNALYYPEIHLFDLRLSDSLPEHSSLMALKDFIGIIPYLFSKETDFMDWYWRNFHPNAPVAPFTLGPISDSALFGGWTGIAIRAFLIGLIFALLKNYLFKKESGWIRLCAYTYLCSTCVLTLKYGFLNSIELLIKNWLVGLLIVLLILRVIKIITKFKSHFTKTKIV